MFIGHYAVGFAAKKWCPKTSLGTLVFAAVFLDILWPLFVLLDMEHFRVTPGITRVSPFEFYDYPLSHSLVMALAWAAAWGLTYLVREKDGKTAWIIGGVVFSHWVLDFLTHRPDLPILPASNWKFVGLGLWNSMGGTLMVEGLIFAYGIWIYLGATREKNGTGKKGLPALIAVLVLAYAGSLFGKLPVDPRLIAYGGLAQLLFVAWAYAIDDNREPVVDTLPGRNAARGK